jgi:glutamine synthetase
LGAIDMANDAGRILKRIKDEEIEWVDLRFTDPRGKWQHLSMVLGRGRRGPADRRLHVRRLVDRRLEGDQRAT